MRKSFICLFLMSLMVFVVQTSAYLTDKFEKKIPLKKESLTFWTIQLKPIYEKEIKEVIKDFEHKNPNYKVVWVDIPIQEAQKRTLASVLSSTPPDLVNLNPDFSLLLAQRNILHYFTKEEVENYQPNLVEKLKYNGLIYAIPFYATSPVTIYNKNVYNSCVNKDFIKSYDELYEIAPKMYECSKVSPFVASLNENDTMARILNKYNVSDLSDIDQRQQAFKVYSMFNDMYKNNFLPKDTLTINHREMVEKYMSNGASIMVAGSNFINMIKQNAPDTYKLSSLSTQLTGSNGKYDVSIMNLIIPKKSKNIEKATEFALYLTNKENQLKLSKLTNVLPANKEALNDDYFKSCPEDLVEQSRCLSATQLNNLNNVEFRQNNKKAQNEAINKALEEILLNSNTNKSFISSKIEALSNELEALKE